MIYHCFAMDEKIRLVETSRIFWQGQEDSNPRPTVLETGTLPAELYPYEIWWANRDSNPGPTGYEPVALTN